MIMDQDMSVEWNRNGVWFRLWLWTKIWAL